MSKKKKSNPDNAAPGRALVPINSEKNKEKKNKDEKTTYGSRKSMFMINKKGVHILATNAEGEEEYKWFCTPLGIAAQVRDVKNKNWGRLLIVLDPDGVSHQIAMPMEMTASDGLEYRRLLYSLGLVVAPGKFGHHSLHLYISTMRVENKVRCVPKIGWHGNCYVLPDRTLGDSGEERVLLQTTSMPPSYTQQGTLNEWQEEIGCFCVGNSRLILVVSAALASPLMELAGEECSGFHIVGKSSCGKTTALEVAASVWGITMSSWRTTDNAAENLALGANDNLLCMDELSQVDIKVAAEMVYMLGNGKRKARMNKDTTSQAQITWRLMFLSSGEITLRDKLNEGQKKYRAGQAVRLVDIPADAGGQYLTFEDIHTFEDGNKFANYLKEATKRLYGTLGEAFLDRVIADKSGVQAKVMQYVKSWYDTHVNPADDGQVQRVGRKFALLAAAGEIAIEMGLLPWSKGAAAEAAKQCFDDWRHFRGGGEAVEITEGIRQIATILDMYGSSRFEDLHPERSERAAIRYGFRQCDEDMNWEYYATPSGFKEMCQGYPSEDIAQALVEKEFMTGGNNGKTAILKTLKGDKKRRLYYFSAANIAKLRAYVQRLS